MDKTMWVETPCEHGRMEAHIWFTPKRREARNCPGGTRSEASVSDLVEVLDGETMWLCREDDRVHDWAEGSPTHCWFLGEGKHNPECGPHVVVPLPEDAE